MSRKYRVLVVDDDRALSETISEGLCDRGFDGVPVHSSAEASRLLEGDVDALVTDLRMPGADGLDLLAKSRRIAPERPVIVMTAYSAIDTAIESIRRGAYHYLTKPFKVDELALFLGRAFEEASLRRETSMLRLAMGASIDGVIGVSAVMREARELAERMASASTPVLIVGETGSGKGLFARAIHARSARAKGPFITLNCAAVPENLLESELFGHVKGAFTGATGPRKGLFEMANGGTLLLDEIGEMSLGLQAKLLDVLERSVVRAVGSDQERAVDVRVLAATHRDLAARVRLSSFREDLLFRLDVLRLEVPPLRHRKEDVPELVLHFLAREKAKHPESPVMSFSSEALAKLATYAWPGNVRELENTVSRAVLLCRQSQVAASDLPSGITAKAPGEVSFEGPVLPLDEVERKYARWAFAELGGKKMLTAEKLNIDRKTLLKLLDESDV